MEGWIKLYRKFLKWEWIDVPEMVSLFIHLLLTAAPTDTAWHGIDICKGQLVTSINSLKKTTGLTTQQIRTCLDRLKSTHEITIKPTNKYSIITICNYETYQFVKTEDNTQDNKQSNKQATNKQQTNNTQDKEYKNIENINNINNINIKKESIKKENAADAATNEQRLMERKEKFIKEVCEFMPTYGTDMLRNFTNYWTEPNRSKTKMRFEIEKTWDTARRLATWASREKVPAIPASDKITPAEALRRMMENTQNEQTVIEL